VKTRFYGDESAEAKQVVVIRALWIFDQALRLLHPVMPFVTEELWQHLTDRKGESLIRAAFPTGEHLNIEPQTEQEMAFVQDVINAVRNIRGENNIAPSKEIYLQVRVAAENKDGVFKTYSKYLAKLARVVSVEMITHDKKPKLSSSAVVGDAEIFVLLEGLIDVNAERGRLDKEISRLSGLIQSIENKLANASFVDRAPKNVVDKEKEKLANFTSSVEKLKKSLQHLSA
jgi:valyl-tRNA synthetase